VVDVGVRDLVRDRDREAVGEFVGHRGVQKFVITIDAVTLFKTLPATF
jgi:hypothetical protein